jgi:4-amino-4-deoxy-L-arabinose transferase-like glycosyltransferase
MTMKKSLWWGTLALVAVALFLRWPSFSREIWNLDEANTCVEAEHVRAGDVLYRDVVDTRTPLLVYILAAEMAVIGDWNMGGQHAALAVMLGLTAALLWRMAARFGAGGAGAWAAAVFTLLQVIFVAEIDAYTVNTEWFVVFFSAVGFWLLAHAWNRPKGGLVLLAGMSFGLSYLAKQPGLFDFGTAVIWIGLFMAFDGAARWPRLRQMVVLAAGFLAVVGGALLYFAAHGALRDFLFYAWTYSTRYYLPEVSNLDRVIALRMPFRLAWINAPLIGAGVVIGAGLLLPGLVRSLRARLAGQEIPLLALGWTASGVLGSGLSGREYGHYAIQVLPGFSLLCGWALHAGWSRARASSAAWRTVLLRGLVLLPLALGAVEFGRRLLRLSVESSLESAVGPIVRAYTTPADRMVTWGFYPEVNFESQRLSASRFVFSNFLTGLIPWTNLDPNKDTAYAIVPGAWEQFWQDLDRHPPAVIVESPHRGYVKYPLMRQSRLWSYIQAHYIEIEADIVRPKGFKVYRRTGAPLTGTTDGTIDPALALKEEVNGVPIPGILHVRLPAGLTAAELMLNGRSTGSLPLPPGGTHQMTFTYLPAFHGLNPSVSIRARRPDGSIAAGPVFQIDERQIPPPPALIIGDVVLPALESVCLTGNVLWMPGERVFSAHAPARLVFDRPAVLQLVLFDFGIFAGAYAPDQKWPTDGVELQVSFQPQDGPLERLLTKPLDPRSVMADRGSQHVEIALPKGKAGQLIVVISPGPNSNASCDWSYITNLTGAPLPSLAYGTTHRLPVNVEAPLGTNTVVVDSHPVVVAHAPASAEFELEPGMRTISGQFGLLDTSWNGDKGQTGGIDFIAEQLAPDGRVTELWRRRLDPAQAPADRGIKSFAFTLATPVSGTLRLRSTPANPPDNSFGYSYWSNLVAGLAP